MENPQSSSSQYLHYKRRDVMYTFEFVDIQGYGNEFYMNSIYTKL